MPAVSNRPQGLGAFQATGFGRPPELDEYHAAYNTRASSAPVHHGVVVPVRAAYSHSASVGSLTPLASGTSLKASPQPSDGGTLHTPSWLWPTAVAQAGIFPTTAGSRLQKSTDSHHEESEDASGIRAVARANGPLP